MEIERKFLISKENLPADLNSYPHHRLEQGYLSTAPVVRIRKEDDNYYLTYKSKGLMTREEYKKRSVWRRFVGWFAHLFTPVI